MSEGLPYADIIILALIAGFILLRLRSILGDKSGNDNPGYFTKVKLPLSGQQEPVVQLDEKSLKLKSREEADPYLQALAQGPIADTLETLKTKDPIFTATGFLQGARMAYEMVFDAFAKGDKQTLSMLLAPPIYLHFNQDIDTRETSALKTETTLVSVKAQDITQASLDKNVARLAVRFISEQVTLTRNISGDILEGNPSEWHHVEDEWIFERDITSKNPNWKIIET